MNTESFTTVVKLSLPTGGILRPDRSEMRVSPLRKMPFSDVASQ